MDVVTAVEFQRWCEEVNLSVDTRQLLKSEGYSTLEEIRFLTESDLEVLNLDSNQRHILERALVDLNTRASQTSKQPTPIISRSRPNSSGSGSSSNMQANESSARSSGLYPALTGLENEFSDPEVENQPPTNGVQKDESNVLESKAKPTEPITIEEVKQSNSKATPIVKKEAGGVGLSLTSDYLDDNVPAATSPTATKGVFFNKSKKDKEKPIKASKTDSEKPGKKDEKLSQLFKGMKIPGKKTKDKKRKTSEGEPSANPTKVIPRPLIGIPIEIPTPPVDFSHPLEGPVAKSPKEKFLEHSSLLRGGYPEIYALPQVDVSRNEDTCIRHCEIATPDFPVDMIAEEKVLLCVGASGAGKTTLINGFVNFLLDVQWDDPYRFQIIPDRKDENDIQSASQTQLITAYTFYVERNFAPFKVTIIDTPGFGDTQGIDRDQQLDDKIRNLFDRQHYGLDQLDAVCFTTQATDTRMNAFQKYIYNRILSIFGKDVEENIFIMTTFADAHEPNVVNLLKENNIPFRKYFKFNNSALFASNKKDDNVESAEFNKMFWNMGCTSFKQFFEFLDSSVTPVTLLLTKEVMSQREALQVYICGLQQNVKKGLQTLDQIRQEMDVVRQHEADIARNRDFTYKVKEYYTEKINKPEGRHVTNCQNCNRTCHLNCKYANDEDKKKCSAMDTNGDCRICTPSNGGKCSWTVHYNMAYYFVCKERVVEKRSEDLFMKYKQATDNKIDHEDLLAKISDMFSSIQGEVLWQTNEIRKCLKQLGEIALKPNPLTTVDYIDQMIIAEKDTCQPGWRERVYQLETARRHAEYLQKLQDEGYDPWEEHRDGVDLTEETKDSRLNSVMEFVHKLKSGVWNFIADEFDDE